MREKLKESGQQPGRAGVTKIDFPVPTVAEFAKKMEALKAGTEGTVVAAVRDLPPGSTGRAREWLAVYTHSVSLQGSD
jgi:hypothetical protein